MSSTTFILSPPSSSNLPTSPGLSLLPFSLGSNAAPYTSTSAPISTYFRPRAHLDQSSSLNQVSSTADTKHDTTADPSSDAKKDGEKGSAERAKEIKGKGNGNVIASFRGRTVVGQYIDVPNGWRGIVLSAGKRPDRGGVEVHSADGTSTSTSKAEANIGSASHTTSNSTLNASIAAGAEEDDGLSLRRTTRQSAAVSGINVGGRTRGAGQVALSRPRTRQASRISQVQAKRRFALDSDSDEDDAGGSSRVTGSSGGGGSRSTVSLSRTPSKRARTTYTTPQKPTSVSVVEVGEHDDEDMGNSVPTPASIPEITIQEATPLKYPLPTPKKRLSQRKPSPPPRPMIFDLPVGAAGSASGSAAGEMADPGHVRRIEDGNEDGDTRGLGGTESMEIVERVVDIEDEDEHAPEGAHLEGSVKAEPSDPVAQEAGADELDIVMKDVKQEELIPSPATEEDPPSFDIGTEGKSDNAKSSKATGAGNVDGIENQNAVKSDAADGNDDISHSNKVDGQDRENEHDVHDHQVEGPIRILRPTARFDGFMLYTPDAPLAGFRADELTRSSVATATATAAATEATDGPISTEGPETITDTARVASGVNSHDARREMETAGRTASELSRDEERANVETSEGKDEAKAAGEGMEAAEGADAGGSDIQLRKGWWRSGGAGEGGDEMVRAMGEWLGLCQVLNKPVYLDGLEDSDDED